MTSIKDYYALLGVTETSSPQEIKKAFKELAFKYHPDRNPNNLQAEEKFKEVAKAYAYISGNQEVFQVFSEPRPGSREVKQNVNDLFDDLFGININEWAPPGKDIYQWIELDLDEAYRGTHRKLNLWREARCETCHGRGAPEGTPSPICTYCFGRGLITIPQKGVTVDQPCPKCQGSGRNPADPCRKCRGRGVVSRQEQLTVTIPPKVFHGEEIRLKEFGSLASRSSGAGDLILQISIRPDKRFTFDGHDIVCEISIDPELAEKGGEIKVLTLEGKIPVTLPAKISSGFIFPLKGFGLKGDQLIKIKVRDSEQNRLFFPKEITDIRKRKTFFSKIIKFLRKLS